VGENLKYKVKNIKHSLAFIQKDNEFGFEYVYNNFSISCFENRIILYDLVLKLNGRFDTEYNSTFRDTILNSRVCLLYCLWVHNSVLSLEFLIKS